MKCISCFALYHTLTYLTIQTQFSQERLFTFFSNLNDKYKVLSFRKILFTVGACLIPIRDTSKQIDLSKIYTMTLKFRFHTNDCLVVRTSQ